MCTGYFYKLYIYHPLSLMTVLQEENYCLYFTDEDAGI